MSAAPALTGARIDRADALRNDPVALASLCERTPAVMLRLDALDPGECDGQLIWDVRPPGAPPAQAVFLGVIDGKPHFAPLAADGAAIDGQSRSAWGVLERLDPAEAALYAGARSLVAWHAAHGRCARCGVATTIAKAGWARRCTGCGAEHFPRTDPVVIMLAEFGGRVLVGHGLGFPPGRMSALAGFVEPGESIEEAVARELKEEAGLDTLDVRYIASQPWPFPSALLIGCFATVAHDRLVLDTTEIDAALWVDRAMVRKALTGAEDSPFIAPPRLAIARTLLVRWLAEGSDQSQL